MCSGVQCSAVVVGRERGREEGWSGGREVTRLGDFYLPRLSVVCILSVSSIILIH